MTTMRLASLRGTGRSSPATLAVTLPAAIGASQVSIALEGGVWGCPGRAGMADFGTRTRIGKARLSTISGGQAAAAVIRRALATPSSPSTTKATSSGPGSLTRLAQPASKRAGARAASRIRGENIMCFSLQKWQM